MHSDHRAIAASCAQQFGRLRVIALIEVGFDRLVKVGGAESPRDLEIAIHEVCVSWSGQPRGEKASPILYIETDPRCGTGQKSENSVQERYLVDVSYEQIDMAATEVPREPQKLSYSVVPRRKD